VSDLVAATGLPRGWVPGRLRIRIIWIREARSGETRRCRLALLHRAIGSIDTVPPAHAVGLQAERRVPAIDLGLSWRGRRQSRDRRKNRQSGNANLNFLSDRDHSTNSIVRSAHIPGRTDDRASLNRHNEASGHLRTTELNGDPTTPAESKTEQSRSRYNGLPPFLPNATAAGSFPCSSGVGSRSGFCPVAMSMIDLASWLGSRGAFGGHYVAHGAAK